MTPDFYGGGSVMEEVFSVSFKARWGDMDFNGHMANIAYLNTSGDVRMLYFEKMGFSMRNFEQMRIGPVIMKDEIEYYREIRLLDEFRVYYQLAGFSENGSRFRVRNTFFRSDGKKAATVTSTGGWLDLAHRTLIAPPRELCAAMQGLEKTDDYAMLPALEGK